MHTLLLLILCMTAIVAGIAFGKRCGKRLALNQAPSVYGTQAASLLVSTALTDRFSLVKYVDSTHVNPTSGAADIPLGVLLDDTCPTAEIDTLAKAVGLLGQHNGTLRATAAAAIALDAQIVADVATPGRVKTLPAAAGTYLVIGRANSAASAAGDTIEFRHQMPVPVVVA